MKTERVGLAVLVASLTACSSGSSGGGGGTLPATNGGTPQTSAVAAAGAPGTPPGAPPGAPGNPPPPPPPGAGPGGAPPPQPTLDQDLGARLQNAGIVTPPLPPAPPQALVDLGRALFFDKILSGDRNISCATCHNPAFATGDGLSLSLGEGATGAGSARRATSASQVIARNAPPLFNLGGPRNDILFRDGRVARDPGTGALTTPEPVLNGPQPARPDLAQPLTSALAAQALFPVASHAEMRGPAGEPGNELGSAPDNVSVWSLVMARLVGTQNGTQGGIDAYRTLFRAAFPGVASLDTLTFSHAAQALAAFEAASFATFRSPLDRYLAGDTTALTDDAKRGGILFAGRVGCARCHGGPLLSDGRFHALAVPQLGPGENGEPDDRGRALATLDARDNYRFRTPPLRNVALTGPYMHDGAFTQLDRVLRHYRNPAQSLQGYTGNELTPALQATVDHDPTRNQARLAAVDPIIGHGLVFNDTELGQLQAFLQSLTDPAAATGITPPPSVPSGLAVGD